MLRCQLIYGLLLLFGPTDCMGGIKYLWPLCNLTIAYEMHFKRDAEYPKMDTCPHLKAGPPELGYRVFSFDGTGADHVSMATFDTNKMSQFSFLFYIYPESNTGIILDFKASFQDQDTIDSLTVEMLNGILTATLRDETNQVVIVGKSGALIPLKSWSVIGVSWDDGPGHVTVQVDTTMYTVEPDDTDITRKFNSYGSLYVGKSLGTLETAFWGRLCCLFIFDDYDIMIKSGPAHFIDLSREDKWPNPAPAIPQSCPVGTPVLHLWPLTISSLGYEVMHKLRPTVPVADKCMRSKNQYPGTDRPVVYWDGSLYSSLQSSVYDQTFTNDFTMAVCVRPDLPVEGVIWDYVASLEKMGGIRRITLTLNHAYARVDISDDTGVCGSAETRAQIPAEEWSLLWVYYKMSTRALWIYGNNTYGNTVTTCNHEPPTNPGPVTDTNGTISIGRAQDAHQTEAGYHGSAACLTFFQGNADRTEIASLVQENCGTLDAMNMDEGSSCEAYSELSISRFTSMAQNSRPDVGIDPIANYSVSSMLECSSRCLTISVCRAFTYWKTPKWSNCQLFDFVTKYGLTTYSGSRYYIVTLS